MKKIADSYELHGNPVSVCDNCERTYPQEWVDICEGLCPFCGKKHTDENGKFGAGEGKVYYWEGNKYNENDYNGN